MYFQWELKTVWILVKWLYQKQGDLTLQCFQESINQGSAGQGLCFALLHEN